MIDPSLKSSLSGVQTVHCIWTIWFTTMAYGHLSELDLTSELSPGVSMLDRQGFDDRERGELLRSSENIASASGNTSVFSAASHARSGSHPRMYDL